MGKSWEPLNQVNVFLIQGYSMDESRALSLDLHAHKAFAPTKYGVWDKVSNVQKSIEYSSMQSYFMHKSIALSLDLHAHNAFAPTKYGVWGKVST